jgi:2EXR family
VSVRPSLRGPRSRWPSSFSRTFLVRFTQQVSLSRRILLTMPNKSWSIGTRACGIVEALQGLDLSTTEKALQDFPFFPQLPAEIRIQIWEATFVPRRIMLRSHSDRPLLDPLIGALLLVNNEAHRVFVENYTLSFHEHGLRGIYINFSIDTLFLNSSTKALRLLLKQYPKTMTRIQWLDLRPCAHQLGNTKLSSMTSLQLLTVRWQFGTEFQYHMDMHCAENLVRPTLTNLRSALGRSDQYTSRKLPTLCAIFPPNQETSDEYTLRILLSTTLRSELGRYFVLREPSPITWARFEMDMNPEWKSIYPGRQNALDIGWFAYELE